MLASGFPYMTAKAAAYHSASCRRLSASVTTTKCQPWLLPPVGACVATSMHSRSSDGSTGRVRSRRLRTDRVVESSSSGSRGSRSAMAAEPSEPLRDVGLRGELGEDLVDLRVAEHDLVEEEELGDPEDAE